MYSLENAKGNSIVMGTSIAPIELSKQKECIASWINNGITVIAFNTYSEIMEMKKYFSDVEVFFYPIKRDAYDVSGKHLPYIQDILDITASLTRKVCGYFNSDIFLHNFDADLYQEICKESDKSLLITHRNEISEISDICNLNWDINSDGIDAFFVDKSIASDIFGDEAYVQTTWDGFLISHCKQKGIIVKTILNPIMFHRRHVVRWNYERMQKSYKILEEKYYSEKDNPRRELFLDRYESYFQNEEIIYSGRTQARILFVVKNNDYVTVESIMNQDSNGTDFEIAYDDEKRAEFDIVVYVSRKAVLRRGFIKFIIFIGNCYKINELQIGGFFVSKVYGRYIYNQLNKSMQLLRKINEHSDLCTVVIYNQNNSNKKYKIIYPVYYHDIDIYADYVDVKMFKDMLYIFPAGYRGGEWYIINRDRMLHDIRGFVDSDLSKAGSKMAGKSICSFEEFVKSNERDFEFIICTKYYLDEIHQMLENKRIKNYVDGDMVIYVEMGKAYVFNINKYKEYLRRG